MKSIYAVYKYDISEGKTVTLPKNAKPLSVITQGNRIVMYALVNSTESETETKDVIVLGTGWEMLGNPTDEYTFLGTVTTGEYVWHIWIEK